MLLNKINYDFQIIDNLIAEYVTLTDLVDGLLVDLNHMVQIFSEGYIGQASLNILPELLQKKIEYVQFLKLCYFNMSEYVSDAKDVMNFIDDYFGKNMSKDNRV